jgi:hypothetical protein
VIFQNASATLVQRPREPDGVTWINTEFFATADEGDWNGGTRGFTVFDTSGNIVHTSGNQIDSLATSVGHFPEARAEAKGRPNKANKFAIQLFLLVKSKSRILTLLDSKETNPRTWILAFMETLLTCLSTRSGPVWCWSSTSRILPNLSLSRYFPQVSGPKV